MNFENVGAHGTGVINKYIILSTLRPSPACTHPFKTYFLLTKC